MKKPGLFAASMAAASATTAVTGSNFKDQTSRQVVNNSDSVSSTLEFDKLDLELIGTISVVLISVQDHGSSSKINGDSSPEKTDCCSEKFAPRFDGLRFIETLVTAHR
ncbi:hypothetical protein SSX86_004659 [Deinandra increscens subsp. villosa]|uniref:Uncharacterized protein n=1 Tax=Deinandra increscens subsp. villosa TaxID=3103831 RepID=A0AAP0DND7_9ASTR